MTDGGAHVRPGGVGCVIDGRGRLPDERQSGCCCSVEFLDLSAAQVFAIGNLNVVLALMPLNALADLGIAEALRFVLFVGSGIEQTLPTAAGIEMHVLQLAVAILGARSGMLQLAVTGRMAAGAA